MRRLFAKAALIAVAVATSACTVTFDQVNGTGNPILTSLTVTEGGQTTVWTSGHFHAIGSTGICAFSGCVASTTVYLQEEAGSLGQPINMARAGGFSLTSFLVAQPFNDDAAAAAGGFPNAVTVRVVGNFLAGGTTVGTCAIPNTGFGTCTLPGTFTGLASATFSGLTAAGGAGGIAIDTVAFSPADSATSGADRVEYSLAPAEAGPDPNRSN